MCGRGLIASFAQDGCVSKSETVAGSCRRAGLGEYARVRSRLTGSPVRRSTASLNFATAPQIPQINNLVRPIHWPSQHTPAAPRFFSRVTLVLPPKSSFPWSAVSALIS